MSCAGCSLELAPALVACPRCHALVYRERLRGIAAEAESATAAGDAARALQLWREALPLLPEGSSQYAEVVRRIDDSSRAPQRVADPGGTRNKTIFGSIGAVLLALLTKAKLLLLGLTKLSTVVSMLAFMGVYWARYGWQFALAFVIGIYIHEMGHVAALREVGLPASAPMFLPGFGAFVRLHSRPATPREDARIGLAGPIWGTSAAIVAAAIFAWTHAPFWSAVAYSLAWLNLLNLIPVWQLDGSRGFAALTRAQRWQVAVALVLAFAAVREKTLLLVAAGAVYRAFGREVPESGDTSAFVKFLGLIVVLSALTLLRGVH